MIALPVNALLWVGPSLAVGAAVILVLVARALPSGPKSSRTKTAANSKLPVMAVPEAKPPAKVAVVRNGDNRSQFEDEQRLEM